MSKESFISEIEDLIGNEDIQLSQEALDFFEDLKNGKKTSTGGFTENGKKIFEYMQANYETQSNSFQSKTIGEQLSMTGRSVAGSMRKLITDGYVIKASQSPITYALTDLGKEFSLDK